MDWSDGKDWQVIIAFVAAVAAIVFFGFIAPARQRREREAEPPAPPPPPEPIADPRHAVAGIVVAIAGANGAASREALRMLGSEAQKLFKLPPAEAAELTMAGQRLAGLCASPDAAVRRLSPAVRAWVGDHDPDWVFALAERVAGAEGDGLTTRQERLLHLLRRHLGQG